MAKDDEKIGFHKGSLATLSKEREELLKMVNIVEQLMRAHISELKNLGVDLEKEVNQNKEEIKKMKGKKDIEDVLDN
jgi:Na+/phosphate symporter